MNNLETLFIGQHLIHLQDVDSTNNFAANLIKQTKVVNGTAILADNQYSGRGQTGNKWQSEAGKNLTISIILQPKIDIKNQFQISKITCLAIVETLNEYRIESKIKWPNDILVEKRKICGILIENSLQSTKISNSIIGIGLNLNEVFQKRNNAVSMLELTGKEIDRMEFLRKLFHKLEKWYLMLENGKNILIDEHYHTLLYGLDEELEYDDGVLAPGEWLRVNGVLRGVNELGQLKIEMDGGKIRFFNNQEVKFVL